MFKLILVLAWFQGWIVGTVQPSPRLLEIMNGSMNRFLTVDETYNLLEKWGRMQQESVVDRVMIGNSTLGNPIYMYGITFNSDLRDKSVGNLKTTPGILLNSLLHPQQKNSLVILLHTFSQLLFQPSQLQQYLLQSQVVYFIPFPNIDSTLQIESLFKKQGNKANVQFRKNRNMGGRHYCSNDKDYGVDINRNFDIHFAELGTKNPCHQQYGGTHAFSENESQVLKSVIETCNIKLVIDLHSYGNKLIYPYAFDQTGNVIRQNTYLWEYYQNLKPELGSRMNTAYSLLWYVADGVYIDWVASKGVRSFAFEFGFGFEDSLDNLTKSIYILTKNQLWIVGKAQQQQKGWIVTLKSLGYGEIYLVTDQKWANTSKQNPNQTILKYRQSITFQSKQRIQNLKLQVIHGNSTFDYEISLEKGEDDQSLGFEVVLVVVIAGVSLLIYLAYRLVTNPNPSIKPQYLPTLPQSYTIPPDTPTTQRMQEL